ncbi:MAG TPA: orotidine-5'-phosphate decarboxylase [Nitrosomonas sp.]|nr:orotidine-5'-phosphate decarboxylase [Nitrosomonas sp.]HQX13577.1 orotidine-5'-phosphate decarboxylase [Nitrosomonas sp.]HRB21298.1 orotidine-5'-phosphate decarboxylase [Nitrosomonas sp.]HRB32963.1 orotidine-5'-phosphate decarboxylase [Nitrosomonas sp.]HRB45624.1 orotidine-5'-phosphate decarboxylase [Nitrosomonas sp.]
MSEPRIIVALDFDHAETALDFCKKLSPQLCRLKIGKELFTAAGPAIIEKLAHQGFDIFLDLKFHDIPTTVAKACKAACELGVWMINVHASGGRKMLIAAREAVPQTSTRLIAVTVLTSINEHDLHEIGFSNSPQELVLKLAHLTQDCGLDGVVCSAQETVVLRKELGDNFCLVTPGIRLINNSKTDDQERITTPRQAIVNGSDYLVIGRPITQASDPYQTLLDIQQSITS